MNLWKKLLDRREKKPLQSNSDERVVAAKELGQATPSPLSLRASEALMEKQCEPFIIESQPAHSQPSASVVSLTQTPFRDLATDLKMADSLRKEKRDFLKRKEQGCGCTFCDQAGVQLSTLLKELEDAKRNARRADDSASYFNPRDDDGDRIMSQAAAEGAWAEVRSIEQKRDRLFCLIQGHLPAGQIVLLEPQDAIVRAIAAAVGGLVDDRVLTAIALRGNDIDLVITRVETFDGDASANAVRLVCRHPYVRSVATERLANQAAISRLALQDSYPVVREAAARKLTDQASLAKVAEFDPEPAVRVAATADLFNQLTLEKLALNDPDLRVRVAAVKNLTDSTALTAIALRCPGVLDSEKSTHHVWDQSFQCSRCKVDVRHIAKGWDSTAALLKVNPVLAHAKANDQALLHHAAATGLKDTAECLLANGADANLSGDSGERPLHKAAKEGHKGVAELLLASGADIHAQAWPRKNRRCTALHLAAIRGHAAVAEVLLANGALPDAENESHYTALHQAAAGGHHGVVRLLLASGASADDRANGNGTPLQLAAAAGHKCVVEALLACGAVTDLDNYLGETALHGAAARGYWEVAQLLLSNGADFNRKDKDGRTALYRSVEEGHREVAELLLSSGADASSDTTILLGATRTGRLELVTLLLAHGAKVNVRDHRASTRSGEHGPTPLHIAAASGYYDVVELLLAHGADVNAQDDSYNTPLLRAAKQSSRDDVRRVVALLLGKGADVNVRNHDGNSPLHEGARDVVAVRLLLESGADIHSQNKLSETPLHEAAYWGCTGAAKLLLTSGADVNAKTMSGTTPLHLAAKGGGLDTVELLLTHGADVSAKKEGGTTPLHEAAEEGHAEVVELLLAHGAEVNAKDYRGRTALQAPNVQRRLKDHQDGRSWRRVAGLLRSHGCFE